MKTDDQDLTFRMDNTLQCLACQFSIIIKPNSNIQKFTSKLTEIATEVANVSCPVKFFQPPSNTSLELRVVLNL